MHPSTFVPAPTPPCGLARPAFAPEFETVLRGRLWRGNALGAPSGGSVPSGFRQLDQELPGGGWPTHCLTELLTPANGIGEIRLLAQSLQTLARAGRQIILLAPPCLPYPDGWTRLGIDPARILMVHTERPGDRLWAIEQSLRSAAFGALLAWVPEVRLEALRRLQLAAAGTDGLSFLFRPTAAQHHPSPAPLRLLLGGVEGRCLDVQLLKRRGPLQVAPLRLHLPELRSFKLRPLTTPASPHSSAHSSAHLPIVRPHVVDRAVLSNAAARPHSAPLA